VDGAQETDAKRRTSGGADGGRLWRRWVVIVSAGEAIGFLAAAVAAPLASGAPAGVGLGLMVLAGTVEGAVLGGAQAAVLRALLPRRVVRRWMPVTAAAAGAAWFVGMMPSSTYDAWHTWPVAMLVPIGVVLGVLVLLSLGVAQWLLLRQALPAAWRWIGWSVAGWAGGLTAFGAVTTPLWHPGQERALIVAIGVLGGAVMAAVMAAVTGIGLVRMTRGHHIRGDEGPAAV
jgi:hypothetical protein